MSQRERYRARRRALSAAMGGEPFLLMGHSELPRNYLANPLPFRQDSTFLYFTGCRRPDAGLLVADGRATLVLPPVAPHDALWHGEVPSPEHEAERVGADAVATHEELAALLPEGVHALPVADPQANARLSRWLGVTVDPRHPEATSPALAAAVVALRLRRDPWEAGEMRKAGAVTRDAMRAAMGATRPGVTDREVQGLIEGAFSAAGMAPAYPPIVTVRGEVLHGSASGAPMGPTQLLLLDAGAESATGYASDVTRTWPVSGTFTPRQREVYEAVLEAQETAIALCRPGVRYRDIHLAAARVLARALLDWGLLAGSVDGLVEQGAHAVFFPHGIGHLIGLDVHDLELFGDLAGYGSGRSRDPQFGLCWLRLDRDLEPGMAVTIEPGLYFAPAILHDEKLRATLGDAVRWSRAEEWLPFGGIRIEDDVLVTDGEPEVLTADIPKAVEAVEALVGRGPTPRERLLG
ncbi:MAG: Xaa-Pro dipeptidase [Myxococcales bacterium]